MEFHNGENPAVTCIHWQTLVEQNFTRDLKTNIPNSLFDPIMNVRLHSQRNAVQLFFFSL